MNGGASGIGFILVVAGVVVMFLFPTLLEDTRALISFGLIIGGCICLSIGGIKK